MEDVGGKDHQLALLEAQFAGLDGIGRAHVAVGGVQVGVGPARGSKKRRRPLSGCSAPPPRPARSRPRTRRRTGDCGRRRSRRSARRGTRCGCAGSAARSCRRQLRAWTPPGHAAQHELPQLLDARLGPPEEVEAALEGLEPGARGSGVGLRYWSVSRASSSASSSRLSRPGRASVPREGDRELRAQRERHRRAHHGGSASTRGWAKRRRAAPAQGRDLRDSGRLRAGSRREKRQFRREPDARPGGRA